MPQADSNEARVGWVRGIALEVPRFRESLAFYEEVWALQPVSERPGSRYFRASGAEHHPWTIHDGSKRRIEAVELGVADERRLEALYRRAQEQGARVLRAPYDSDEPGGGRAFELLDPDNRRIRISAGIQASEPLETGADRPKKISHVVLNSPALEENLAFYEAVLGFRVSDWSENQMVFLRCTSDHHSIAFNRAEHPSLNHVAFEMPSIDGQMRGIGRLKHAGFDVAWGVGRHGPGNNTFSYFIDPNGFVVEYTAEIEQVDEATHRPRVWERVPHLMDLWGTAGPPSALIREAMAGEPDAGYAPSESRA